MREIKKRDGKRGVQREERDEEREKGLREEG